MPRLCQELNHFVQAGWAATPEVEQAFKVDAEKLCPSVRVLFVDGRDAAIRNQAWASADVFTSLSDNVQETFGLTPVEAMAAGLPVVVSDWNGYKETVRHGVDGYRVPTLTMAPGMGQGLADRLDMGTTNYQTYLRHRGTIDGGERRRGDGSLYQAGGDTGLRRAMGDAGRTNAITNFDWAVILPRYISLWEELAERRRSAPMLQPPLRARRRADRPDPCTLFRNMARAHPRRCSIPPSRGCDAEGRKGQARTRDSHFCCRGSSDRGHDQYHPRPIREQWQPLSSLNSKKKEGMPPIEAGLVWLAKAGILEFRFSELIEARS